MKRLRRNVPRRRAVAPKKGQAAKSALREHPRQDAKESPYVRPQAMPIVGVGASAGGLEAFTQLLHALPANTGMAFVLVQHLEPRHESMLTKLLSRSTAMPVHEIRERMQIEANHVYVIPANTDLSLMDGLLHVVGRKAPAGHHLPIDYFFRSLAETRKSQAIGVILSGTASDGTAGLEAIKTEGGITFAQEPASARYDGMPRNAIAAGCVDFVLPPERIAAELARIAGHPFVTEPLPEEGEALPGRGEEWARLFRLLRTASGVDFNLYKKATIRRRLGRRMALHKLETIGEYLKFVEQHRDEIDVLFREILIPVTGFFRDPEVFAALREKVLPQILEAKRPGDPVRIWVPGCSSGEEAYSIIMSLLEYLGDRASNTPIQIFGTDINEAAIDKARAGVYSETEMSDVSSERRRRFFTRVNGSYSVDAALREPCVFARQDLTKDPPFSRLDLLSCRNVLIYLEPFSQQRVLSSFHYALKDSGMLMLGKSESLGAFADLFAITDRRNKFFAKSLTARVPIEVGQTPQGAPALPGKIIAEVPPRLDLEKEADRIVWERYAHSGIVVNNALQILHFRGDTSPYLQPAPGRATLSLLRMLREELQMELRGAIQEARKSGHAVRRESIPLKLDKEDRAVNLEVRPLPMVGQDERCFLILFDEPPAQRGRLAKRPPAARTSRAAWKREREKLETELAHSRAYLQAVIQEHESANEELKTANEEAMSSMEELQSANEELETAKEELQSSNEELVTLNEQLQNRNAELSELSTDLGNILAGVDIPIVALSADRRIRRFTAPAEKLLGVISADIGRPISKLRLGLNIPDLDDLIGSAIKQRESATRQVQSESGRWYALHVHPFIPAENNVQGLLLVFVDIHESKKLQERTVARAEQSESIVLALLESAAQAILAVDKEGRIKLANATAERMFGYSRDELLGDRIESLIPERLRAQHVQHRESWFAQPHNRTMGIGLELAGLRKDGSEFPIEAGLSSITADGEKLGVAFVSDITERKKNESALSSYKDQLASEVIALDSLRKTSDHLWRSHDLRAGLEEILDAGIDLLKADFGNIQLLNPEKQVLEIVAQRGFGPDFLEHFREVSAADDSACGRTLRSKKRIITEDVNLDAKFAAHRAAAAAAGYRAVQSTPLFGSDGAPLGMFSTHFHEPHRPSEEELARFDLYANQAAQFMERLRADQRLQGLSGALLEMQESGNREVARALHDSFSQELVGVGLEMESLKSGTKSEALSQRLSGLSKKVMEVAEGLHRTSRELHPAVLEDLGLVAALQQECDSFQKKSGMPIDFTANEIPANLRNEIALCLYRVVQESLRNISKHAAITSKVRVSLTGRTEGLTLRIEDSGDGFELNQALNKGGLGIISMRERVRLVNGKFAIRSAPGQGTTVETFVPLNKSAA